MIRLLLDYDAALAPALVARVGQVTRIVFGRAPAAMSCRRTVRGWHVVVLVPGRATAVTVVACQAVLGSDPYREMFNLRRARRLAAVPRRWRRAWNVLYGAKLGGL